MLMKIRSLAAVPPWPTYTINDIGYIPCILEGEELALSVQVAVIVRTNYDNTAFAAKNKAQTANGAANHSQPVANRTVALSNDAAASTASFKSAP